MKSNIGQVKRKGAQPRVARGMTMKPRSLGWSWVFDRQPALSLDEEPVVHGSGGAKLKAAKEGEL